MGLVLVWMEYSQLKAHRAYLYEMISFSRIELISREGRHYAGEPLRPIISKEKESACMWIRWHA